MSDTSIKSIQSVLSMGPDELEDEDDEENDEVEHLG